MKSVLYGDKEAAIDYDKNLVSSLVYEFVGGGKDKQFNIKCTEKIINNIHSEKWNKKYKSKHFVHIFDIYSRESFVDIKFMWMCEVLEILYFFLCHKGSAKNIEKDFSKKLRKVYKHIYNNEINYKTANVLRTLRNNVAHTGTIDKIKGVLKSKNINAINGFKKKYKISERMLVVSFNLLMEDIFMRCLGLDNNEMFINGLPPQFFIYFKN